MLPYLPYSIHVYDKEADKNTCTAADREKYVFAAQLAVLQSCPSVVSRLLHKDDGSSCLLATKVFVVSRLLLRSLLQKVRLIHAGLTPESDINSLDRAQSHSSNPSSSSVQPSAHYSSTTSTSSSLHRLYPRTTSSLPLPHSPS